MNLFRTSAKYMQYLPVVLAVSSSVSMAKGDNELNFALHYTDQSAVVDGEKVSASSVGLGIRYLRSIKSFWAGAQLDYVSKRSTISASSLFIVGAPFKYWMKGPESKGVGFYVEGMPYLGKDDAGLQTGSLFGLSMGPGCAVFLNDMAAIDSKLFYDYRHVSSGTTTLTGLTSGLSIFF
jgi:hypothetical protein